MEFVRKAMLVQHKDNEICRQSTSGGAFTAIAEYVIENGGRVYGASFDKDFNVKHVVIDSKDELNLFRNSKYVQSSLGNIFQDIEKQLLLGELVCFSGTPCQVEGLRGFLGKEYANLILIDVVCRAVPSPGVWKKYVAMLKEESGAITSIRFRDKSLGYQYSTMEIKMRNGTLQRNGIETQPWLRMFFSGMIIRPSCTECHFRDYRRNSDFTIWDCFNSYWFDKSFDERKGTTRVLIHTIKAFKIFENIKVNLTYTQLSPESIVQGVDEMEKSPTFHPKRNAFYQDLKKLEMKELLTKYFPLTNKLKAKNSIRIFLNRVGVDIYIKRVVSKIR